ncbi:CHAT domain-containing protein [Micromonospora chersina]|uniref:CHAT domain-containing protein n=1 Tax=Micromonospora chersina TaxID=47854 RepID=UPI0033B476C9
MSVEPLDEWIAQLITLVAEPPPGADEAELTAMLGQAYLERYDHTPDDICLAAAAAAFDQALTLAPTHEQAVRWHWGLGTAHLEQARLANAPANHHAAVAHLSAAYQAWPAQDSERDLVAVDLIEAIWNRFFSRCLDEGRTPEAAATDADHVVNALRAVEVTPAAPNLAAYARMFLGMALLARYDDGGEREQDLDQAVDTLADALSRLPPDTTPHYAIASADLAAAYLEAAGRREDRTSIELALTVAARAIAADEPDEPTWLLLHRTQAIAYAVLWDLDDDPANLAKAIAAWQTVHEGDPNPTVLVTIAELLHTQAVRTSDPGSLSRAVGFLEQALPSITQPGPVWRQLGETHLLRWQLGSAPGSLDVAERCLAEALAAAATADESLTAHTVRVVVANEMLQHHVNQDPAGVPLGLDHMREALKDAGRALDDLLCADATRRAVVAIVLLYGELARFGEAKDQVDLPKLRHLLAVARSTQAELPPGFAGLLDTAEGLVEQYAEGTSASRGSNGGLEALLRAGRDETFTKAHGQRLRMLTTIALTTRASGMGDLRGHRAANDLTAALANEIDDQGTNDAALAESYAMSTLMEGLRRGWQGDFASLREAIDRAVTLSDRLQPSRQKDKALEEVIHACQDLLAMNDGTGQVRPRLPTPLPAGPLTHHTLGTTMLTAMIQVGAAERRVDLPLLRKWADHLADLAHRIEPGHLVRMVSLYIAAKAELAQATAIGDRPAAARAARHLEVATAESGGPENMLWTNLVRDHAQALRRAGDPDRARTRHLGLAALQGHARRVLLQAGTDHAMDTAREAAADATMVVRWCLQDQADDDLVTALDAGRGLVLHAATTSRTVADLLREAGQPRLAEEWLQTGGLGRDQVTGDPLGAVIAAGEVPDDLRPRVLRVLETAGLAAGGPLSQVRVEEIHLALTQLDVDALVYLVPAADPVPGFAVVVPATGQTEVIELPDLAVGDGSPVHKLLRAALGPGMTGYGADTKRREPRDAGPVGDALPAPKGTRIDDLCRWAWRAAMGQVVDQARSIRPSGPSRLVLIPMGVLGLVPWHAAYRQTPSGRRYAIHELVISYSPSAQLLCAAAQLPAHRAQSALVVGDPLGDLPFAGAEARAIHQRFHPEGRYLGGPENGPDRMAHPDNVLNWIRTASGPSLLHLACHGRVDPGRPADSHLVLAGGPLPARQLLDVSRIAALELSEVFLAACTTNLVAETHDEAFSLATAFLAAGAQTVFGSLWSVPDVGTSLLMYLVHHFLYEEGLAPADALHRAQLWMINPARQPPCGMPDELAAHYGRDDNAEPLAWAAFTHLGR